MAKYNVEGFLFETEEEARQAKKEAEGIMLIRARTRMNNPDVMFKLYNRLLEQNLFETVVGLEFLREIQSYLDSVPYIKKEDIAPIPVPDKALEKERELRREKQAARRQVSMERRSGEEGRYRRLFHIAAITSAVLAAMVIGMFAITLLTGNNINIFNYEQKIIDRYEEWDKELTQREEEVKRREEILQYRLNP